MIRHVLVHLQSVLISVDEEDMSSVESLVRGIKKGVDVSEMSVESLEVEYSEDDDLDFIHLVSKAENRI